MVYIVPECMSLHLKTLCPLSKSSLHYANEFMYFCHYGDYGLDSLC